KEKEKYISLLRAGPVGPTFSGSIEPYGRATDGSLWRRTGETREAGRPWRKPKVLGLGSARPSLSPRLTYGWKRRHSIRILLHQDSSSLARAEHRAYAGGTRRSGFHQRVAGRDAGTGRSEDRATGALKFSGRIRCSQCGRCRRTFSGLSIPAVLFVRRLLPLALGIVSDWSFSLCSMWNKSFLAFLSGCVSTRLVLMLDKAMNLGLHVLWLGITSMLFCWHEKCN
ncbi:unnamed protein product, partial [Musa hybrid cultivar]